MTQHPTIAVTMGDPAGIGPEIIMKSAQSETLYAKGTMIVVGDADRLREAGRLCETRVRLNIIEKPAQAVHRPDVLNCIDLGLVPEGHPFGEVSSLCGRAAFEYVRKAVDLVHSGQAQAICTAPLNKEALHRAGHHYPGHTELLAHLTGTAEVSMLLTARNLRVIHVTTHIGLLDAIEQIQPPLVERTIDRGYQAMLRLGIPSPRIGVCGINPHAGENGLFGRNEEADKIVPAVQAQQALGRQVEGPLPADTLFFRAVRGDFDLVVAMYHDQGHGPVKVLGMDEGVNITVGLPFIRTSVDHGTAFDIAGTGQADERSMITALAMAFDYCGNNATGNKFQTTGTQEQGG